MTEPRPTDAADQAGGATPVARPRRRRGLRFYLVFALFLIVSTVVIAEVALRIYNPLRWPLEDMRGFYRLDAQDRIETVPGWEGAQFVEGKPVPVHMNALGLRGPELGPKRPGEKRVLMVGDSYVWGQGVVDDATVPARLQELLRADGHDVTVGNAGMFGAGPREWGYTVARHRDSFQPDAVVAVLYVGNDIQNSIMDPLSVVDGWLMASGTAELRESWRFRLRVWSRLWDTIEKLTAKKRLDDMVLEKLATLQSDAPCRIDEGVFLDRDPAQDASSPFLGKVEGILAGFFAEFTAATRGLPTLVVLVPAYRVVNQDYAAMVREFGLDPKLHQRGRGHGRLRRLLEADGHTVVDLADRFFGADDRRELFLKTDWHFSAQGCRRVATWLQPAVEGLLQ